MAIRKSSKLVWVIAVVASLVLAACSSFPSQTIKAPDKFGEFVLAENNVLIDIYDLSPTDLGEGESLRVAATTNIVADVVANIGGEAIELTTLIPLGADPHTYEPTPGDYQVMVNAHVIFLNGVGLEEFMYQTLKQVAVDVPIVSLSEGIELGLFGGGEKSDHQEGGGSDEWEDHDRGEGEAYYQTQAGVDPHVWFDAYNVIVWAENAAQTMSALDPANTDLYEANAFEYVAMLKELDAWIQGQVARVVPENRKLVTDHLALSYFGRRYGFEMVGAVIPAYSMAAQPSAQEIAELVDTIGEQEVKAVFVGTTVNPRLAERIAEDTGVELVRLYIGSLSEPDGPAGTYITLMQYDVNEIVQALLE
ncbi:MAG: zinc ABC transporter substrate-binding protein [Anaerolineales bacterium]|nr:zinc ABC transporter substrate-binding protein [Anaerolineales bacterium]